MTRSITLRAIGRTSARVNLGRRLYQTLVSLGIRPSKKSRVTRLPRAATHLSMTGSGRVAAGRSQDETGMDLLERLGEAEVPPVPAARDFTAGVRRKLHPRLLALHVAEFACGATAWAVRHMFVALFAAVLYTVTGSWPRWSRRSPD